MSSEILDSYGRVKIVRDNLGEIPKYIILPPMLSEGEKRIVENPTDIIADFKYVMQKIGELSTSSEKEAYIRNYILEALATRDVSV